MQLSPATAEPNKLLDQIEEQMLEVILRALEAHDPFTAAHCRRVGIDSQNFAKFMGLSLIDERVAFFSGSLHDLGKDRKSVV